MTTQTSAVKREIAFDALKFFAIFLVLWGHSIQYLSSTAFYDQPVYRMIYSFHMPLFMTLVGYFSNNGRNTQLLPTLGKKFRQLLYPALSFGVVFLISGLYMEGLSAGIEKWVNAFWFLKSAFCCAVIYFIGRVCLRKATLTVCVTLALSQCILFYRINLMYPCFIFGVVLHEYISLLKQYAREVCLGSGLCFAVMLAFWSADFWNIPYKSMYIGIQPYYEFWFCTLYRIVIGLVGTLFFISLFLYIFSLIEVSAPLQKVCSYGQETLGIYILQTFLLETFLSRFLNLDGTGWFVFNFIITPLISLAVLASCIVMYRWIKKSSFLSLVLLGKKSPLATPKVLDGQE